jgi:CTP:molybdopterin cytidylyltransferase MocA
MNDESVFTVVLAAGDASRFGATKQLAEFHGEALVRRAVRLAASVCGERCLLVTGKESRQVIEACLPIPGFFIVNENYRDGIGGSLAMAARSLGDIAEAVIVLLADQPLITSEHLKKLIAEWRQTPGQIIATAYANTVGPPAIFPGRHIEKLAALTGDRGAKAIIAAEDARTVRFEPAAADVDRPEDLDKLQSE